jgi:hypothetical protein
MYSNYILSRGGIFKNATVKYISLFQALNTPHGFSGHLYDMVTERLGLSFEEIISLIKKNVICIDGYCYDLGDVGNNCC